MHIRAIRTLQELAPVRAHWQQWQDHVNNDLAQFELVCRHRTEVESPWVIVIEQDSENNRDSDPDALLLGRIERNAFAPSIGYLQPVRMPARVLVVIHQGLLGRLDDAAAGEVIGYLRSQLRSGVADAVAFHHLPEHSPLWRALQAERGTWSSMKAPRWSTHHEMLLPDDGSTVDRKLSAKHRSNMRRHQKALEAAFPGRVVWRWMNDVDDIAALCAHLEPLAARAYQRALGAGFFDDDDHRRRYGLFARRGQLRVQLLEIDSKVRAFWIGSIYSGVFNLSETGYDPDLREFKVGTQLFIRLADALAQEGVRRLDFGLGDAPYKARFGDRSWRETPAWLFAPTAKGVAMMLLLKLSLAIDAGARRLVQHAGLTDRIKTGWRRRKAASGTRLTPSHPATAKDEA